MANELISFEWEVYQGGYRTISGERQKGGIVEDALVEDLSLVKPAEYRCYSPLKEHTGLFRTFATTALTPQGIKTFADTYGLLGLPLEYRVFDVDDQVDAVTSDPNTFDADTPDTFGRISFEMDEPLFARGGEAEPLEMWRSTITTLKTAVDLWDLLRKTRTAEERGMEMVRFLMLHAEVFEETKWGPAAAMTRPKGGLEDAKEAAFSRLLEDWEKDKRNWRPVGWMFLRRFIDGHLKAHTAPSVIPRSDRTGLALSITPKNLLGALWLQVAQAVSGNLQHRECEEQTCGKWFEVSTRLEGKRKNREYCSDACRQKTYRRRKRQARTLAAEGHTIEAIAQRLDSDLATVRDWVGPRLRLVR